MITATKVSIDTTKNGIDTSLKSTKTNLSSKTNSESYKVDDGKSISKSETYKSKDFKKVLSSKINSEDTDTKKADEVNENETSVETIDNDKLDELKENLKELEIDSELTSNDNVNDILNELVSLLTKLGVNEEDLKSNGEIKFDILKTTISKINENESSKSNLTSVIGKVIESLKTNSVNNELDTDSLKSMEKLLNNFSDTIVNDNTEVTKDIKSDIKNLKSEVSNMLDNNQSQSETILDIKDVLNENKSNDILTEFMNLTSKLSIDKEDIESNSDVLETMNEDINSKNNLSSAMGKLMQLLKTDSVKNELDTGSLKLIEKLSSDLSVNIADDNTELTEDIKSDIKDLISEISNVQDNKQNQSEKICTDFTNLINKLVTNQDKLKSNGEINFDILKTIANKINGNESSENNLSNTVEKVIDLLKTDSVKNGLDTDSLKSIEKVLNNISANIADDNSIVTKDTKSVIKNLMSEMSNMLDNKQNQSRKVLTLEDMLNKNYSQDNNESSTESESNKEVSKEDKFLSSLLDDNTDSSTNKINLFASRTQTIQNQGVATVNGLTINKATLGEDLIKDVKYMSNNGLKELTVKINPGNLGEITIKLIEEDGVMKANLKANSKETAALLAQNLADIKNHLNEQNIKISDVNIELYQEDTTFFSGEGRDSQFSNEQQKNSDSSNSENGKINTEESLIDNIATIDNGNVNFLA